MHVQDEDETWQLPYGAKKTLYGVPNRVPVGGRGEVEASEKGSSSLNLCFWSVN